MSMLRAGIFFILSPVWLSLLDRNHILPHGFEPLIWSLALGALGIIMIVFDQSSTLKRAMIAGILAALVLAVAVYSVEVGVLS